MSNTDHPTPQLYAAREPIFPKRVHGNFRSLKWVLMALTLGIYYLTPWIRWDRGAHLPDQAVLIDLGNRRFFFFMIEIWPHEFYFVAGLLIMAGLGLFLFTSALGRVWCGYACPQTVWTDLFILVERWIEGDRNNRLRLHRAPWSLHKARLRITKWVTWLLIALATGGAWVFYFTDAPALLGDLVTLNAHPAAYITMAILTLTTFVFGGFAREQICIYACPWPRIQAAMMDEDTITIGYREWRGEPRGKGNHRKRAQVEAETPFAGVDAGRGGATYPATPFPAKSKPLAEVATPSPVVSAEAGLEAGPGDCIDCMACVNVCPMGIDIRDGQQLECITCGLCIDACNEIMDKIGKPRDLIGYMALTDETLEREGKPSKSVWSHVFRIRTMVYTVLWAGIGIGLVVALFMRPEIDFTVSPIRNPQYVTLSDGSIRNTYDLRIRNKSGSASDFHISITSEEILQVDVEGTDALTVNVPADTTHLQRVYVIARPQDHAAEEERSAFRFWVEQLGTTNRAHKDTVFHGTGD